MVFSSHQPSASLFKWRHEARLEREKKEQQEKAKRLLEAEKYASRTSLIFQFMLSG
jgi:hypothetical protein